MVKKRLSGGESHPTCLHKNGNDKGPFNLNSPVKEETTYLHERKTHLKHGDHSFPSSI